MKDVAIIGVGNMGEHHARIYSKLSNANLVAVCDNDKSKQKVAEKYRCSFYQDYKEMLKNKCIDAVSVAVPTFFHFKIVLDLIKNYDVDVLVEKPITGNLNEAKALIREAEKRNKKLCVGHIERFNPAIQKLKKLINSGRFGKLIALNIKRVGGLPPAKDNNNVILDLAIHDIDIANYLTSGFPVKISGTKSKNLLEQPDSALILLNYPPSVFIEVNWVTPAKIRKMDITGTKAFAQLDYIEQSLVLYENGDKTIIGIKKEEPLKKELACFLSDDDFLVSNKEAYSALDIALRI